MKLNKIPKSELELLKTGLYYEEYMERNKKCYKLKWKKYGAQLGVWLLVTIIVKLILLIMLKICKLFLVNLGGFFLSPFSNAKLRLVMVMIIFPVILNALYFWVVDNILKLKESDKEDVKINGEKKGDIKEKDNNNINVEINQFKDGNFSSSTDLNENEVKLDEEQ